MNSVLIPTLARHGRQPLTPLLQLRCALALLLLTVMLQACGQSTDETAKPEGTAVAISGYNYTIEGIQEFSVNGAWGGGISIGGGGGQVCCVQLPDKWTPGLSAAIKWKRSDCRGDKKKRCPERIEELEKWPMLYLGKEVAVEPYDRPNSMQVMFLPDDEIKIYAAPFDPEHPQHPAKLGRPHPIGHPEWKP